MQVADAAPQPIIDALVDMTGELRRVADALTRRGEDSPTEPDAPHEKCLCPEGLAALCDRCPSHADNARPELTRLRTELAMQKGISADLRVETRARGDKLTAVRDLMGRWAKRTDQLKRAAELLETALDGPAAATPTPEAQQAREAEAIRQLDAEQHTGTVVKPYTEHGEKRWVFRCWGTDTCDGWLSLEHSTQSSAEAARDRHVAEEHSTAQRVPCTASIRLDGGHVVRCHLAAHHMRPRSPGPHDGLNPGTKLMHSWYDTAPGATPHIESPKEQ
jgi:hypothetical protein